MDTKTAEAKLEDYLQQGILKEILVAEQSRLIAEEIGNHVEAITAQGYSFLFGTMQVAFSDKQTLCTTKMFDPPDSPRRNRSQEHNTRSIPSILALIVEHASLWSLPQKASLQELLISAGNDTRYILSLDNAALSNEVVVHFNRTLPTKDHPALKRLLQARNKVIAHNDAIPDAERELPTWGDATTLIDAAKDFVATICWGFLGFYAGKDHTSFYLSADAYRETVALRKLFEAAGLR